jgi:hypothetical protein
MTMKSFCSILIAVLLSACHFGGEKNTSVPQRAAPVSTRISAADRFLIEIERSVGLNDSVAFVKLCRFPLPIKRSLDYQGMVLVSENDVISSFTAFMEEYRGEQTNEYIVDNKTGATRVKEQNDTNRRSILASITAIKAKGVLDSKKLELGPLIAEKNNGYWEVVRIYSDIIEISGVSPRTETKRR